MLLRRLAELRRTLVALNGSPRGIAGGFALGLGLSLVPLPFAGMFVALALAPALRANLPATYLGTAVVNPVTGAVIYFAELWLGMTMLGRSVPSWSEVRHLDAGGWWDLFVGLLGPFMLGAAIMIVLAVAVAAPAIYVLSSRVQAGLARRRAANAKGGASQEAPPSAASPLVQPIGRDVG